MGLVMQPGRPRLSLAMLPEQSAEVRRRRRSTRDMREKERCQAVLLAYGGQHACEEITEVVGRARSTIPVWVKEFGARGGGKPAQMRDERIRQGLQERHGLRRSLDCVYCWLGKLGGGVEGAASRAYEKEGCAGGRLQ